jgi:hypothetical protein
MARPRDALEPDWAAWIAEVAAELVATKNQLGEP